MEAEVLQPVEQNCGAQIKMSEILHWDLGLGSDSITVQTPQQGIHAVCRTNQCPCHVLGECLF